MKRSVKVKLEPDEIFSILSAHLTKEGFDVQGIKADVETVNEGYGMNEHAVRKFTGCTATCTMKVKVDGGNHAEENSI